MRLIINVLVRFYIFPDGNIFSYDESITLRNLTRFHKGLIAGKIDFHPDSDGYLTAIILGTFLLFLGNEPNMGNVITIWIHLVSLFLIYAVYKLLTEFEIEKKMKWLYMIGYVFFDWIIFPTTNFRSESMAIPIMIYLFYLNVSYRKRAKNYKWLILFEVILAIAHFLTFFFYSILIILFYKIDNHYSITNNRLHVFGVLHLFIPLIYKNIFDHRSFDILRALTLYNINVSNFSLILILLYLIIWTILINTRFLYNIHSITQIIANNIRESQIIENLKMKKKLVYVCINFILIITLILITGQYQEDIQDKGWITYGLNSWKIFMLIYFIFIFYRSSDNVSVDFIKYFQKLRLIKLLLISSIYLFIIMSPVILVIYNVHLRLLPTILLPIILALDPLLKKIHNSISSKKFNFIFFLLLWINIFNGSAIILPILNS